MSTSPQAGITDYSLGFYARQPVFDRKAETWAYSIYFRDGELSALPANGQLAGAQLTGATNNVLAALMGAGGHARRIIKFAAQSLLYELPLLFPQEALVVEVREDVCADLQVMEAIRGLKAKGYTLAVSHFTATPTAALLYSMADVIWVDALGRDEAALERLFRACRLGKALAGLMRIEIHAVHEAAKKLGFDLFQGNFFKEPELVSTRRLSSSQFSRLKLLQAVEQEAPDLKALAETIRTDVALSYKLFGLLNSAYFSFPCKVQSVQQAVGLLGWEPLRTWIRLVILTDLTPAGKSSELPRAATLRGRFLELCARSADTVGTAVASKGLTPEELFLMGLFSLLPALLDQDMASIVQSLRLPEEVAAGLLGGDPAGVAWLGLAASFESADWAGVQSAMATLGLDPVPVAQAYAAAQEWTDALYRSLPA